MTEFIQIWQIYPRKVAKAHAQKIWARMTEVNRAAALDALPKHLRAWEVEGRLRQYYPHLGTWLCQERWEDEIDLTEEIPVKAVAWWASEAGILERGRELGLHAKGGESMQEFKARVVEAARRAA